MNCRRQQCQCSDDEGENTSEVSGVLTWCAVRDDDDVDAFVANGQVDEQRRELGVGAGAYAERGVQRRPVLAQEVRQREPQLHEAVGVDPHRPPPLLVHLTLGARAHVPDLS